MKCVPALLLSAAIIAAFLFPGCIFSTANLAEVTLAKSIDAHKAPVERTAFFYKHDPTLHCCVRVANAPSETKVKAIWYYHVPAAAKQVIDSTEMQLDTDSWIDFNLTPQGDGLPYGDYSIDLFLNGKQDRNVTFQVKPMHPAGPVKETVLAANVNSSFFPLTVTKEFPASSLVIYAPVFVENPAAGDVITAKWYTRDEAGTRTDLVSTDYNALGTGWVGFSIKPNNSLPPGKYWVDILHNGSVMSTLDFALTKM